MPANETPTTRAASTYSRDFSASASPRDSRESLGQYTSARISAGMCVPGR